MEAAIREVPKNLRVWFVVHFAVDMVFAIPLLLVPEFLMPMLGWTAVDPITSRLVGAALLAIGVASLLERNANRDVYKSMLTLKILWASGAVAGIGIGIAVGGPPLAWLFLAIFAAFLGLWVYYRIALR